MKTEIEITAGWDYNGDIQKVNKIFNYIGQLYTRIFNNEIQSLERITVELVSEEKEGILPPDTKSPWVIIKKAFNFKHCFDLKSHERRVYILDTLYEALHAVCTELNYDFQPFRQAYEHVKALNYQNRYVHGKLKTASDRRHKAGVHIRVEEEHAVLSALVQNSEGNETARIEILCTLPHYMFIYKFIHQTKWLDKEHFQISDKSGQVVFIVNVPEGKAHIQLLPKTMELPELIKEVAMAVADEIRDA